MFEVPVGQVEAHILDFDEDIYGKTLRVMPVQRLRGEAKFDNLDQLIEQMEKDCKKARDVLEDLKWPDS
jgi:riboflavin kinase/FMN adenylyltransferase